MVGTKERERGADLQREFSSALPHPPRQKPCSRSFPIDDASPVLPPATPQQDASPLYSRAAFPCACRSR